jgi:hypothetical protein
MEANLSALVTPVNRTVFSKLPVLTVVVRTEETTGPPPPVTGGIHKSRRAKPPNPRPNKIKAM